MGSRGGAFSLLICLSLTACATQDAARPSPGEAAAAVSPAEAGKLLLPSADNGLELRRWRITDYVAEDSAGRPHIVDRCPDIAAALMKHADGEVLDGETAERLRRNGFRFVRVPADQVDALMADLGGVSVDVKGWHGQACDWREVTAYPVNPAGRAVAVDGHVRRFADGRLRLMMRGWTIQMEDGPHLHLEVMPDYNLARPGRLEQALGRKMFQGERFHSMSLDLLTEAGYAYVLACESPGVEWVAADESDGEAAEPGAAQDEAEQNPPRRDLFAAPGVGPEAAMPFTIGELLLREEGVPPGRQLLLFVPHIPDALFPSQARNTVGEGES